MKAKYESSVNAAWVADTFIASSLLHNVIYFMKYKQITLKVKLVFKIFLKYLNRHIIYMIIIYHDNFSIWQNIMIKR